MSEQLRPFEENTIDRLAEFLAGRDGLTLDRISLADVLDDALGAPAAAQDDRVVVPLGLSGPRTIATMVMDRSTEYFVAPLTIDVAPTMTAWDVLRFAAKQWAAYPVMNEFEVVGFDIDAPDRFRIVLDVGQPVGGENDGSLTYEELYGMPFAADDGPWTDDRVVRFLAGEASLTFDGLGLTDIRFGDGVARARATVDDGRVGVPLGRLGPHQIVTWVIDYGDHDHLLATLNIELAPDMTAWDVICFAATQWAAFSLMDDFEVSGFRLGDLGEPRLALNLLADDELADDELARLPLAGGEGAAS